MSRKYEIWIDGVVSKKLSVGAYTFIIKYGKLTHLEKRGEAVIVTNTDSIEVKLRGLIAVVRQALPYSSICIHIKSKHIARIMKKRLEERDYKDGHIKLWTTLNTLIDSKNITIESITYDNSSHIMSDCTKISKTLIKEYNEEKEATHYE